MLHLFSPWLQFHLIGKLHILFFAGIFLHQRIENEKKNSRPFLISTTWNFLLHKMHILNDIVCKKIEKRTFKMYTYQTIWLWRFFFCWKIAFYSLFACVHRILFGKSPFLSLFLLLLLLRFLWYLFTINFCSSLYPHRIIIKFNDAQRQLYRRPNDRRREEKKNS